MLKMPQVEKLEEDYKSDEAAEGDALAGNQPCSGLHHDTSND